MCIYLCLKFICFLHFLYLPLSLFLSFSLSLSLSLSPSLFSFLILKFFPNIISFIQLCLSTPLYLSVRFHIINSCGSLRSSVNCMCPSMIIICISHHLNLTLSYSFLLIYEFIIFEIFSIWPSILKINFICKFLFNLQL